MLVPGVRHSDSVMYFLFQILFHFKLLQGIEYSHFEFFFILFLSLATTLAAVCFKIILFTTRDRALPPSQSLTSASVVTTPNFCLMSFQVFCSFVLFFNAFYCCVYNSIFSFFHLTYFIIVCFPYWIIPILPPFPFCVRI